MSRFANQMVKEDGQGRKELWKIVREAAELTALAPDEIPTVLRQSVGKTTCSIGYEEFSACELGNVLDLPFCLLIFNSEDQLRLTFASAFCWKISTKEMHLESAATISLYNARLRADKMLSSIYDHCFAMSCILKNGILIHLWNQFYASKQFNKIIKTAPSYTFNEFRTQFLSDWTVFYNAIGELELIASENHAPSFMKRIDLIGADRNACKELALNSSCQNEIMNLSDLNLLGVVSSLFLAISESTDTVNYPRKAE